MGVHYRLAWVVAVARRHDWRDDELQIGLLEKMGNPTAMARAYQAGKPG